MSGRSAREIRQRYLRVLAANPLPDGDKAHLMLDAQFMAARLQGEDVQPPPHWLPDQVAGFEKVLATEEGRTALFAIVLQGWQSLNQKANALTD